jgi:probable selenium-dependent hydroxylase accessory protein YqeC
MDWTDALALTGKDLLCFVGAGGKSSLIRHLAKAMAATGRKVLVSTTTKMFLHQLYDLGEMCIEKDPDRLIRRLECGLSGKGILTAARALGEDGKVSGLSSDCIDLLFKRDLFQLLLIEADGARGKSLKAPATHEPVIPEACTLVLPVVGLDVLGRPLTEEYVHRPQIVSEAAGIRLNQTIAPEVIIRVMLIYRDLAQKFQSAVRIVPIINKADSDGQVVVARDLGTRMISRGFERILVTSTADSHPLREVVAA